MVQENPTYLSRGGFFADYIEDQLAAEYGGQTGTSAGGLRIHTTLDAYIQRVAEETIASLPRTKGRTGRGDRGAESTERRDPRDGGREELPIFPV